MPADLTVRTLRTELATHRLDATSAIRWCEDAGAMAHLRDSDPAHLRAWLRAALTAGAPPRALAGGTGYTLSAIRRLMTTETPQTNQGSGGGAQRRSDAGLIDPVEYIESWNTTLSWVAMFEREADEIEAMTIGQRRSYAAHAWAGGVPVKICAGIGHMSSHHLYGYARRLGLKRGQDAA